MSLEILEEVGTISGQVDDPDPNMLWPTGAFPRLNSIDGDGSYGTWSTNLAAVPGSGPWIGARFGAGPAGATKCIVTLQVRPLSAYELFPEDPPDLDENGHAFMVLGGRGPAIGPSESYLREIYAVPLDAWTTIVIDCEIDPDFLTEYAVDVAAGELRLVTRCFSYGFDLSAMLVNVDADIPLRIRQRGDGLGMGGPRVRGVGSRQRSPRVRGYV